MTECRTVLVALAVVRDSAGRLLIARRKADAVLGGFWELPGGKIEQGETAAQFALREAREELGVEVQPLGDLPTITHRYDHATVTLHPVLCRWLAGQPEPRQVDAVRWVSRDELDEIVFPPANAALIQQIKQLPVDA